MVQGEHLVVLGALLALACGSDVTARRVPNALGVAIAIAGVVAQWAAGGAGRALAGLLAGAIVLGVFFAAWASRRIGGGDLKLAAATAIWLGPRSLIAFVMFTAIAGVPVALAARAVHRLELWRIVRGVTADGRSLQALTPVRETAPLAVAIALGAGVVLRGGMP
jgi:prepilin peptidase CpaA